jgi:RNA polymerase sigma factor (sigma-70 family)
MEASRAAANPRLRRSLRLSPLRLKRQAEPAFEQLYRRHARDVYQYALAVLANPADAEDVTQTTFLNAYRAFQRGERPRKPQNWLIAIAHNVCRMRWRQAAARPREVTLDDAPEPVAPDEERPNLDEVLTALARLSFNQRSALVMRELEGRSYQEIAEVLGTSVSAVEALLFRARRRLQVNRKALGVLTTAPLPSSLGSVFGASGAAAVAGGTIVGADLVLKAAAVVAAGAVATGAGVKGVQAVTGSHPAETVQPRAAAVSPSKQRGTAETLAGRTAYAAARPRQALRRAHEAPAGAPRRPLRPSAGAAPPVSAPATGAAASATAAALPPAVAPAARVAPPPPPASVPGVVPTPPAAPVPTVPQAPAVPPAPPLPALPALPPAPPLPVQAPPLPPPLTK